MLSFRVFVAQHPRPPLVARRFTLPVNISTHRCPRIIEAPVMERISRQPRASRGVGLFVLQALSSPRGVLTSLRCFLFSKSFICNIYTPPHKSVANKRLTRSLNPLDATFTRNRGWGVPKRRFPTRLGPSTENLLWDWIFSPAPGPRCVPAAADANSASRCSNKCSRTAFQCKSPALPYPRCLPNPFRPCELPAGKL